MKPTSGSARVWGLVSFWGILWGFRFWVTTEISPFWCLFCSRKDKLLGHLSLFEGHFPLSLAQLQGQPGSATNEGVTGTNASGEEEEDSSSESAGEQ